MDYLCVFIDFGPKHDYFAAYIKDTHPNFKKAESFESVCQYSNLKNKAPEGLNSKSLQTVYL